MKTVYVRPSRCTGCRSCEIACAVAHSAGKTLVSAILERPAPKKRLYVEEAEGTRMPVVCRHCEDAPCLNACISGSLYRDEEGFVRQTKEKCIGCWSCVMMCPFGVMTRNAGEHVAAKCDSCPDREAPACVSSCPTKAMILVDVDELPRLKRRRMVLEEVARES